MKIIATGFLFMGLVIGVPLIGVALNIITIPWLNLTSKVQTSRDIVTKTYTADNALYNYRWFKERAGSIRALEDTIAVSESSIASFEASAGPRKEWTFEDKGEHARLSSVLQGQKAQYNSIVQEYNARMKQTDRALFKDELPLFFDLF